MIAETKPTPQRRLEGCALLVGSTQSCHVTAIDFATFCNAPINRSVDSRIDLSVSENPPLGRSIFAAHGPP